MMRIVWRVVTCFGLVELLMLSRMATIFLSEEFPPKTCSVALVSSSLSLLFYWIMNKYQLIMNIINLKIFSVENVLVNKEINQSYLYSLISCMFQKCKIQRSLRIFNYVSTSLNVDIVDLQIDGELSLYNSYFTSRCSSRLTLSNAFVVLRSFRISLSKRQNMNVETFRSLKNSCDSLISYRTILINDYTCYFWMRRSDYNWMISIQYFYQSCYFYHKGLI